MNENAVGTLNFAWTKLETTSYFVMATKADCWTVSLSAFFIHFLFIVPLSSISNPTSSLPISDLIRDFFFAIIIQIFFFLT